MMRRALVNNCGLFFTAYNAGVNAALCEFLGTDYFNASYSSSGSVFASAFCAAGQPETMLHIWRHLVCDGQLVSLGKPFRGRKILDLDYLINVFQSRAGWLNLEAFADSPVKVFCVLTKYDSGEPIYAQLTRENIWAVSKATAAMPFLHGPVETEYGMVIDGGLVVDCPVQKALDDGYEEVVVVYNRPSDYSHGTFQELLYRLVAPFLPRQCCSLFLSFEERSRKTQELFADPRVTVIRPSAPLPLKYSSDGDKDRLNATIDRGYEDGRHFAQRRSRF